MANVNVESFRPNSYKSKNANDAQRPERKHKIKAPVAKVKTQKKPLRRKMKDIFISSDVSNAKEYLLFEIIVPSIKETIVSVGNNALELIFGVSPKKKKNSSGEPSYAAFYKSSNSSTREKKDIYSFKTSNRYSNDDVIFETRIDAEDVLDILTEALDTYGNVTVADFKDAIGITGDFIDNEWGWIDLRGSTIKRVRNGYLLILPDPVPIN